MDPLIETDASGLVWSTIWTFFFTLIHNLLLRFSFLPLAESAIGRGDGRGLGGALGLHVGSEVVLRFSDHTVTGHQHCFILTFARRWSSDLSEQHKPGGRHLQRGSGGHTEQPWGGAAHYLTAKRCSACVFTVTYCDCESWPPLLACNVLCTSAKLLTYRDLFTYFEICHKYCRPTCFAQAKLHFRLTRVSFKSIKIHPPLSSHLKF